MKWNWVNFSVSKKSVSICYLHLPPVAVFSLVDVWPGSNQDSNLFSKTNDSDDDDNDDDIDDDDGGDGDGGDGDNDLSFVLAALGPTKSSARSDVCTRPRT